MKTDWQNLLWSWTTVTEPYGFGHWNVIIEGLVESLSEAMKVCFVRSRRIFYDIRRDEPSVAFSVHYIADDPKDVRMVGRCSIDTFVEDDGTKRSGASIVLFHYQGEQRIVQSDGKCYEYWQFSRDENDSGKWASYGWFYDECGEWESYSWNDLLW